MWLYRDTFMTESGKQRFFISDNYDLQNTSLSDKPALAFEAGQPIFLF